jgi:maltose O-acetyltransferase
MKFLKEVIIISLTGLFLFLNLIKRLIHFDTLSIFWRYAKWKARLKHLGKNVNIYRGVVIHGCDNVSIRTGTCIAEYVHMWGGGGIDIGENVLIAAHAVITSQTHDTKANIYNQSNVRKKVCIEDNVWIGTHAIILPGITIGRNTIIGAGAVVTKDIPANDIVVGIPARTFST